MYDTKKLKIKAKSVKEKNKKLKKTTYDTR